MDDRPIIYMFTATKWQNVNFVPAMVLGPIDRLVVLVGERGGRFRDLDEQDAIVSSHGFAEACRLEFDHRGINSAPQVLIERGPLTGVRLWRDKVMAKLAEAPPRARIVFNYLSGPTDVKIGAWLALDQLAGTRTDLLIDRVAYQADSRLAWFDRDTVEPAGHCVSLDSWLALSNRTEAGVDHDQRMKGEHGAERHSTLVETARRLAFQPFAGLRSPERPADEGWYTRLANRINQNTPVPLATIAAERDRRLPSANPADVREFCAAFGRFAVAVEAAIGTAKANFRDFPAHNDPAAPWCSGASFDFLRSGWFEELIYLELRQRAPQATIALNLKVTPRTSEKGNNQFEIDVAVLGNNQLHVIEAKAYNPDTADDARKSWIEQAQGYRESLVGPGGLCVLAMATKFHPNSEIREWARLRQVRIAAGWEEIDRALDDIARAVRPS